MFDSSLVKSESETDIVITGVINNVLHGWPSEKVTDLEAYECRKRELHVERDCLMWGHRVIPNLLRSMVLNKWCCNCEDEGVGKVIFMVA